MKKVFLLTIYPFLALGQVISPTNPYTKSFVAPTSTPTGLVRQSAQQKAPTLFTIVQEFEAIGKEEIIQKKEVDINPLSAGQITGKIICKKTEP